MILMNLIVCCALHTDCNVYVRHVCDPFHMTILNQRTEGTEGSAIKNHLIKRPFWYSFCVVRCWFMRILVMFQENVTDKLNQ